MPDLFHSLLKQDIGHLRIIAQLWGLDLDFTQADDALEKLSASLLNPERLADLIDSLSPEADSAISTLVNSSGRLSWTTFTRKYGGIREAGAGQRDREKLHLMPSSTTEILYYRGLLARAFFDTKNGTQEFAYIPDDLLPLISQGRNEQLPISMEPLGRPASPGERGQEIIANDSILDESTTILANFRMHRAGFQIDDKLMALLSSAKLIKKNTIQTEAVKKFLEASRSESLKMLHAAWLGSGSFNELKLMPNIVCEGEWTNQPLETREFLMDLLDAIPEGKWWSLNAFIRDIKTKYADFQRPAGDYDSWFIKRASDGQYLRGFAYWDQVDGALIRYFITSILHWLGQVDLSISEGAAEPTAFRITPHDSQISRIENERLSVSSQGRINIPRLCPRVVRYQVSRFCDWDESKQDLYRYHISTKSLTTAGEQGLKPEHLLTLLVNHTDNKVPPSLVKALKQWEVNGTEAWVETQTILRVSKPEILGELRKSRAVKHLGEVLSPTAVIVKGGAIQKVMDALAELGLLTEIEDQKD